MIAVLVSGNGSNLRALLAAGLPVVAVASNVRGAPALEVAAAASVPTGVFPLDDYPSREDRDLAMAEWLGEHAVELVVCAGYMHLLTPAFLARFPAINVHPSLLPAFPGTRAVEQALAAGVSETGVTVHFVDEGVDTGPVIGQEPVPVLPGDTPETLHARIRAVEHRLLPEVVGLYLTGRLRSTKVVAAANTPSPAGRKARPGGVLGRNASASGQHGGAQTRSAFPVRALPASYPGGLSDSAGQDRTCGGDH